MSCTLLQIQTHLLTRRRTLKPSPKFTTQISIWPLYHLPKFWPAFFCEIRQKFIVRIPMCGKNTFRWPRAYRDEAFKALGRTGRLATIITHYHPRPPFFLIGREKKSMRSPPPLSLPSVVVTEQVPINTNLSPTRLKHVHVACGTSVLVLLDHTFRVGRMSAQLVVCDLTIQAFPGGEQWELARLARKATRTNLAALRCAFSRVP